MFKIVCRSAQLSIFFRRHQTPTPNAKPSSYSIRWKWLLYWVLFWQIIKVIGHFRWVCLECRRACNRRSLPNEFLFSGWSGAGGVIAPNTEMNRKGRAFYFGLHTISNYFRFRSRLPYSCISLFFGLIINSYEIIKFDIFFIAFFKTADR